VENDSLRVSAGSAGETDVWWPHRPEDREVERRVAQLGEDAGIVARLPASSEPDRAADSVTPSDSDAPADVEIAAAADAVLVEYLLMQRLSEEFPGTEFVPYGYPLESLRGSLTDHVASLSDANRQTLLQRIDDRQWQEGPDQPVISNPRSQVIYEGSDWEDPAPGLIPIDPDPQSVEK
jgi:hypothetical protein